MKCVDLPSLSQAPTIRVQPHNTNTFYVIMYASPHHPSESYYLCKLACRGECKEHTPLRNNIIIHVPVVQYDQALAIACHLLA